jgi:hypothetical protein
VKGRAYARELQAMAMTAGTTPTEGDEGLEAGGFRVSRETLAALRGLDLAGVALPALRACSSSTATTWAPIPRWPNGCRPTASTTAARPRPGGTR